MFIILLPLAAYVSVSLSQIWKNGQSNLTQGQWPHCCSVLFFSCPRSEGWLHHGCTFSIYLCPLTFRQTLPQGRGRWKCETWTCGTWKCGTILQGWKMRDMNLRHQLARVEIARHENARNAIIWNTECCICLSIAEHECMSRQETAPDFAANCVFVNV